jgi:Uma2 family endonuclease
MGRVKIPKSLSVRVPREQNSIGAREEVPPIFMPVSAGTLDGFRAWVSSEHCPRHVRVSYLQTHIFLESDYYGIALEIPVSATNLDGFCEWAVSDAFPERGRICFLDKEIFIDMSQEEIETHAKVKGAVSTGITVLNEEEDLGEFYPDGTGVANEAANLEVIPDGTFVKWSTFKSKRVVLIPRKDKQSRDIRDQYMWVRGRPDCVMEVVSNSSVKKDTEKLMVLYHRAKIPEYWLIDSRGEEIQLQILVWRRSSYVPAQPRDGWHKSPVFGRSFRLERTRNRIGRWNYKLAVREL